LLYGWDPAFGQIIEDQVSRYERGEGEALLGLRQLKEITIEMKNALLQRKLNEFGELLGHAWETRKSFPAKSPTL